MNRYDTPVLLQRADPYILLAEDSYYYFTATVPTFDRIELRRARSIEGLAAVQPEVIWRRHEPLYLGTRDSSHRKRMDDLLCRG